MVLVVTLRNRKFLRKFVPAVTREALVMRPGPVSIPKQVPPQTQPTTLTVPPSTPKPSLTLTKESSPTQTPVNAQTPVKRPTRIFRRSINADPSSPITPVVENIHPPQPTADPEYHKSSHQKDISLPTVTTAQGNSPETKVKRTPLLLKQLKSYNAPGLTEDPNPTVGKRVTRQSANQ